MKKNLNEALDLLKKSGCKVMLNETTAMTAPEYVLGRSMVDALEEYIEDVKSEAEPDDEFVANEIIKAAEEILDDEDLMNKGMNAFLDATGFWEKYNKAWDDYHSRQHE
jgi:hypothetical protein